MTLSVGEESDCVDDSLGGHGQEVVAGELSMSLGADTVTVAMVTLAHDASIWSCVGEEDALETKLIVRLIAVPKPGMVTTEEVDMLRQIHQGGNCGWQVYFIVTQLVPKM